MATAMVAHPASRSDMLNGPRGEEGETRFGHGLDRARALAAYGLRCRGKEFKDWSLRQRKCEANGSGLESDTPAPRRQS